MTSDALPPQIRARFDVREEVARGSTGVLYRATETASGIVGVLKVLHAEVSSPRERMRMTRDLARQASLASPHLAIPVATGEATGRVWVFRRWVEGESARALLERDGPLEVELALGIAGQVALALDELHRTGLLHRDVAPRHILRNPAGSVVLIDAGVTSPIPVAGAFEVLGTPAYVSPEHASGKVVSFRSDLYALGCTLYELLTGAPPFVADTPAEVLKAHAEAPPPPPPEGLPEKAASLLTSLLAKNPRERPFSANNVAKVLRPYIPSELRARPSSVGVTGYHPATLPGTGPAAPDAPPEASGGGKSVPPPPPSPAEGEARPKSLPPPPPPAAASPKSVPPPPPAAPRAPRADATVPLTLEQVLSAERADPTEEVTEGQIVASSESTQPLRLEQIVAEESPAPRSMPPPPPGAAPRPTDSVGAWPAPEPTRPMDAVPVTRPTESGPSRLTLGIAAAILGLVCVWWILGVPDEPAVDAAPAASGPVGSAPAGPTARAPAPTPGEAAPGAAARETGPSSGAEIEPAEGREGAETAAAERGLGAGETADEEPADEEAAADEIAAEAAAEHGDEAAAVEASVAARSRPRHTRASRRPRSGGASGGALRQGQAHLRAGRNRQAEQAFERAVRENRRSAEAWAGLGVARIRQGNARGALQAYQRAVRLSPNNSTYFTYLGRANARVGNTRAARQAFRRALSLNPRNRAAKRGLDAL